MWIFFSLYYHCIAMHWTSNYCAVHTSDYIEKCTLHSAKQCSSREMYFAQCAMQRTVRSNALGSFQTWMQADGCERVPERLSIDLHKLLFHLQLRWGGVKNGWFRARLIFIGPRCPWGPIYGSGCLSLTKRPICRLNWCDSGCWRYQLNTNW